MVKINKYFKASALASLTSLLFLVTPIKVEAQPKKIAIFIDGNMDCCATSMNKTRQEFANLGIEVYSSAWNSVYKKSESQSPKNTAHFIKTMKQFISTLPQGTELYLVGHSFGGDSILQFLSSYRRTNVKFKFVAVLDAVGFGGQRSVTRNNSVGSNVEYFYNRWQNNSPWPVDFRGSGNISCSAKSCDQKDQSISRHPDGSARKTRCADHEVTCPGYRVDVSRGYPRIIAGEKQTRLHHQYVPTDPLIETQIIEKVKGLVATASKTSPGTQFMDTIDIPISQLGSPGSFDARFRAVNDWAGKNGYAAAFPNFHQADYGQGVVYGTILLKSGTVDIRDISAAELGNPPNNEARFRAVNDWAGRNGDAAAFPNFHQADYGQGVVYGTILIKK